jgi:hypothetical protein
MTMDMASLAAADSVIIFGVQIQNVIGITSGLT